MNRIFKQGILYVIVLVVIVGIVNFISGDKNQTRDIRYDEFTTALKDNKVESYSIKPSRGVFLIEGTYKDSTAKKTSNKDKEALTFTTFSVDSEVTIADIKADTAKGVKTEILPQDQQSGWITFLTTLLPFLLLILFIFFMMSQAQGGGGGGKMMNFGKSKAKLYDNSKIKVRFADVAGADEEKQELVEVVDFLKDPRKFASLGAKIPKGVLLVGPPGTGKTLLAKAVAGEAGTPFFSISGSDFVEMFVGVGASRVRDLFEQAKKNAPCIIFIDEIDAVGRQRGAGVGGGHDEREQTLNQLLVEMDGFQGNEGIIMIAATNRADVLDPALLRPGRFDRQITVDRPDVKGREAVLKVHARNKPLAADVDLKAIAQRTPGFSGADLENLLNEGALVAARRDKTKIDMTDIDEATDRVIAGPAKKNRVISKKERTTVAYHEAGHTIIGTVLDEAETVHKVTIVPRGQAGGYAVMMPKEDRFLLTKNELLDRITGLLGGRVAEDVTFGEVSTGASNDFERATEMAHRMVTEWGMSDKIGPLQFKGSNDNVFLGRDMGGGKGFSDQIAFVIDSEVQRIINECYARAKEILTTHQVQLETIAQKLLEIETLNAKEIRSLFDTGEMPVAEDDTVVAEAQEVVVEAVGDADVAATVDEQVIEKTEDKQ